MNPTTESPPRDTEAGTRGGWLRTAVESWWLRIAVLLIWGYAVQDLYWQRIHYTGDEPHYMMSAVSFLHDGDFNLANNYAKNDQKNFAGWPGLRPQLWKEQDDPNIIPSAHGTIFPIIIAPAYKWDRIFGVRYFTILIAALATLAAAWVADLLTGSRLIGSIALFLLAFSPTWEMQASRTYPETLAALLGMLGFGLLALGNVGFPAMLALGFITVFLPVLYTKYVAIGGALGLVILALPDVRRKFAVWLGMAIALGLGLWNRTMWGREGASAGDFWASLPDFFKIDGFSERVWRPFLDRDHGLWPYQPFMILALWAAICLLRVPKTRREIVLTGLGLLCAFYIAMHGIWAGVPGHGVPGRYLSAAVPAFCIALAIWVTKADGVRPVRILLLGVGLVITLALYVIAFRTQHPQYEIAHDWRLLWPRYFDSWEPGSHQQVVPVGATGTYWLLLIVFTKLGVYFWNIRHQFRTASPLPTLAPPPPAARTVRPSASKRRR